MGLGLQGRARVFVYQKAPKTKAMRVPTFIPNWPQLSTKRHEHLKNCLKTRFLDGSVPKALPRSASRAVYSELLVDFWQFWDPHRDLKIDQKRSLIQNPDPGNRFFIGCSRQYHFSRFWHRMFIDFRWKKRWNTRHTFVKTARIFQVGEPLKPCTGAVF